MSHPLIIKIATTGATTLIYHPEQQAAPAQALAAGLGQTALDRRGAYVYPQNRQLRSLFKALRRWCGSAGRVAAWTRAWRCRWVVVLPGECVRLPGVYRRHSEAVAAEVAWILEHKA